MTLSVLDATAPDLRPFLEPDDLVIVAQVGAEPMALTGALLAASRDVPGLRMLTSFPLAPAEPRLEATGVRYLSMDGFGANGKLFRAGRLDIAPARFSDYWRLYEGRLKPGIVLCSITPPDADGNVSLGVTVDHLPAAIANARVVLAEINPGMPRTGGDAVLPLSAFAATIPAPGPPAEWTSRKPGPVDHAVAAHVARLVPDKATVQYGIGSLPDAVAAALASKRELGVHSGSVADSYVDLIEAGAVSNRHKEVDAGVSVATTLYGSRRLYDHVDRNPALVMRAGAYTHSAQTLAHFDHFYAINSALEVDLTGQVGAEAAGTRYLGAIGGQLDFQRAGLTSRHGRAIIALGAQVGPGGASRIVKSLSGPVTTPRADADTVVTEHGVAELAGLTLGERAEALIAIAAPEHRAALRDAVEKDGLV